MISNKIAPKEAFNRFDDNQDGFLSFSEFSNGIDSIMTLSTSMKEKFFAVMDKHHIGLVDYPSFLATVQSISVGKSASN